jgi:hypothetical protein
MRSGIAAFFAVFVFANPVPAQTIPVLAPVSAEVAAGRPDLSQQRAVLVAERGNLRARTERHNARCSAVEEGSAAAVSCRAELDSLNSELATHISRSHSFNEMVRAPQSGSSPSTSGLTPTVLRLARSPVVLDELLRLESAYMQSRVPAQRLVSSDLLRWVSAECLQPEGNGEPAKLRHQLYHMATAELARRGELPESEELGSPPKAREPTRAWPGSHSAEPPLPNPLTTRTKDDQVGPTLDRLRKIFQGDPFMDALLATQGANAQGQPDAR